MLRMAWYGLRYSWRCRVGGARSLPSRDVLYPAAHPLFATKAAVWRHQVPLLRAGMVSGGLPLLAQSVATHGQGKQAAVLSSKKGTDLTAGAAERQLVLLQQHQQQHMPIPGNACSSQGHAT